MIIAAGVVVALVVYLAAGVVVAVAAGGAMWIVPVWPLVAALLLQEIAAITADDYVKD